MRGSVQQDLVQIYFLFLLTGVYTFPSKDCKFKFMLKIARFMDLMHYIIFK